MFPYANELTPFETDRSRELLQTARILNIRVCISSYIPVFRWNQQSPHSDYVTRCYFNLCLQQGSRDDRVSRDVFSFLYV